MRTKIRRRIPRTIRTDSDDGLTLIEVLVAMVVLGVAALGSAGLSGTAVNMVAASRLQTTATVLAAQKMNSFARWRGDSLIPDNLLPVTDGVTDLSQDPMAAGGAGLSSSPGGTLLTNTAGYVDYLDKHGAWAGNGATPPAAAVFIRRWNVTPLAWSPADALVLRVLVTTVVRDSQASPTPPRRRLAGDAMLVTVLTRKAG